jgi:hypothetical protein
LPPKQFVKLTNDSPRSPRNEQSASIVVLTSCVVTGCSYDIKTRGRDGSPGGPFFFLMVEHQQVHPLWRLKPSVALTLWISGAGLLRSRRAADLA